MSKKRREVGDYWIDQKIGSGTYAKVYKCTHKNTEKVFAMKAIDKKKIEGRHLEANLELEISIMMRYRHRNLVHLMHTMRGPKNIFLVMEYCGGGDLAEAISKHGPLPESKVEPLLAQLACGLEFLWSRNLVHRDIKPQNILLTGDLDSTLKLADFGFARYLGAAHLAETACGSPLYMAPEVLRREGYNNKADLWSVGCVLFEMLTKLTPFTAYNEIELLRNVEANKIAKIPNGLRFSAECANVLRGLLRQDQIQRISFQEFFSSPFVMSGRQKLIDMGVNMTSSNSSNISVSSSQHDDQPLRRSANATMTTTTMTTTTAAARSSGGSGDGSSSKVPAPRTRAQTEPAVRGGGSSSSHSDDFLLIDTTTSKQQVLFTNANSGGGSVHGSRSSSGSGGSGGRSSGSSSGSSSSSTGGAERSKMSDRRPPLSPRDSRTDAATAIPIHRQHQQQHQQHQHYQQQQQQQHYQPQQHYQQQQQQQQHYQSQQHYQQQQQQQQQQQHNHQRPPPATAVHILPTSMQASEALPDARQSDQLWRRGLAVGQLAEVLLCSTHAYGTKECVCLQEEYGGGPKAMDVMIDKLTTSLSLSTRSLELLRVSFERRSRSGRSLNNSLRGSTASMDASSSTTTTTDVYEKAMRNQIVHYTDVTRSATKQLHSLLSLRSLRPENIPMNDWEERAENAIHSAVLSMSRRAAGLQALTSTCTTSDDARKHSSSHAQSLYEHSLCLLEDLLANVQENQLKFMFLSSLAEKITGRLKDLMSSSTYPYNIQ